MAKKNKNQPVTESEEIVNSADATSNDTATVENSSKSKKVEKQNPQDSKLNKNSKKKKEKKERGKLKRRLKETGSELKKVSWPKFGTVAKKTGVVLAIVAIFTVVLFGFDYLLKWLFGLLVG